MSDLNYQSSNNETLSRCSPETLKKIGNLVGEPVSTLNCMVISSISKPTYTALTNYIAISRDESTPIRVDEIEKPLWVEQQVHYSDDSDSDSDSFDEYYSSDSEYGKRKKIENQIKKLRSADEKEKIEEGKKKNKIYKRPVLHFGHGQTTIVWPPLKHLTAKNLFKKEIELRENKSNKTINNHPPLIKENEEDEDVTKRNILYVVSCDKQNRAFNKFGGKWESYNELIIFSKSNLNQFIIELLEWENDRIPKRPQAPNTYLELYRLRVDSGCNNRVEWKFEGLRRSRSIESVVLKGTQMDLIIKDLKNFLNIKTKKWYKKNGIPLRRQYLFYGEPGTGKTSTIKALSSKFNKNCCFLNVTNKDFSNQILTDALFKLPDNCILVLEDVDALFHHNRTTNTNQSSLTFSVFLNALDGILSIDGVITIMTTNHIEKLDQALLRVGRIDKKFYFGPPDKDQIKRLFLTFYDNSTDQVAESFVQKVYNRPKEDKAWSMSTLQELFVACREMTDKECVENVDNHFEELRVLAQVKQLNPDVVTENGTSEKTAG